MVLLKHQKIILLFSIIIIENNNYYDYQLSKAGRKFVEKF